MSVVRNPAPAPASNPRKSMDDIASSMIVQASNATEEDKRNNKLAESTQASSAPELAASSTQGASSGAAAGGEPAMGQEPRQRPATRSDDDDEGSGANGANEGTENNEDSEGNEPNGTGNAPEAEDDDPLSGVFGEEDDGESRDHERDANTDETDDDNTPTLRDDVKLSVTVDGEDVTVTLGELKRRYAGEGAIEKRLQAATEARTQALSDYERGRQLTEQVFQNFGQMMFRRTVEEPSLELLNSNPPQYMRQKALFDQETQAIADAQGRIYQMTMQLDQQQQALRQQQRAEAARKLREIMPVFADPVKGPKVKQVLIETAREIGYTDEEIAACEDPLMFKVMALAARELRRNKAVKASAPAPKARTLAKVAAKGSPVDSNKRREVEALKRARRTGSVDDVAASMIVQPKRKTRGIA